MKRILQFIKLPFEIIAVYILTFILYIEYLLLILAGTIYEKIYNCYDNIKRYYSILKEKICSKMTT